LGRVLGDLEMDDPSSMVTKDDHGIQQLKCRGGYHEHVDRGDGCHSKSGRERYGAEGGAGRQ
jgi:hypothetical protein